MSVTPDDRDPTSAVPGDEPPAAEAPEATPAPSEDAPAPSESAPVREAPAPAKYEPGAPRFVRAFLAVNLPVPAVRRIADEIAGMKAEVAPSGLRVAWVPAANLHVTVKFLGPIRRELVEGIRGALAEGLASLSPFELEARGTGAFPSASQPRVVWVGLRDQPALVALQQVVEARMEAIGLPREGREFRPHLTIGRIKEERGAAARFEALEAAIAARADLMLGGGRVTEVVLYESRTLGRGAEYHPLARVPIGAGL